MAYRRSYPRDPGWLTAQFPSDCAGSCGQRIAKGDRIFFYPKGRGAYGERCGCAANQSADFEAMAADEAAYNA